MVIIDLIGVVVMVILLILIPNKWDYVLIFFMGSFIGGIILTVYYKKQKKNLFIPTQIKKNKPNTPYRNKHHALKKAKQKKSHKNLTQKVSNQRVE